MPDSKVQTKRTLRTVAIIAVVIAFLSIIFLSLSSKPSPSEQVWTQSMSIGSSEATNHYIMYTDIMCPYCDVFSRVVQDNWDEFLAYLDEHKILFEVRLTDYLYEASGSEYSRASAEAAYCAARDDKFWDFYHGAVQSLWEDYHSKGIGDSKTSPMITNLPQDYWLKIGHEVGLGADFDECVSSHSTVSEIEQNTQRALQVAQGMPFFKFNRFTTAGFDSGWGWDYVKMYLDAGLKQK